MPTKNSKSRRGIRKYLDEAVSAVGWRKLVLWSAVAAVPVAVASNTFWLIIETILPPSMARGLELVPYFGGMFAATVVGQLMGPYAALRWELEKLDPGYRMWFGAKNPLAELNQLLWNMGTEAEPDRFQSSDSIRTDDSVADPLDKSRAELLTAVSRNLESVPKLFHISGTSREDVAEFGSEPTEDCLVSLARRLREAGWGQVEMKPRWEWVVYSPSTIIGSFVLLIAMIALLALVPGSGPVITLAVQWPFYLAAIALFMLPSAGRPSGLVKAALPTGLRANDLDESLALAHDPFERIRLFLGALPLDDQKALLEATHYALWKTLRSYRTRPKSRASR
jgi:hypothetical protein